MMNLSFILKISKVSTPCIIICPIMHFIIGLRHSIIEIIEISFIVYMFSVASVFAIY